MDYKPHQARLTLFLKSAEIPLQSKRLVLMFLFKSILGVSGFHTFGNFFVLTYTSSHPLKTECFLLLPLKTWMTLGKIFCVIMCYTVTTIKHKKN